MFRPSKLREKAKIEEKSLLEVQLFSMELVNFLYSKCKNWAEKSVESELLSILVKNESISDILDRIKTVFAEKFVKLDDLIKMNAEKCAADLVKSFGRTQFINELVATQRENGGNFETILKKSYKQIKEKPTREWTVHDDKKLILRLYEEGVDNYRFVSKNTRFGMEQTEIDENKRNLAKLGVIRKEIESTKDGVVSTLKLENRFDAIFNFWSGCAVRKSEMEDD
ncbi:hypothetical protein MHBO_002221 [Bonamia ostreae]|uniref:Uncharacterized protein n=1 Tax=Bonamia ostreae TaxID=126728 RepID=A0ABV2ALR4_9EUKA